MQAELIINLPSRVERFILEKGSYNVVGLRLGSPILVTTSSTAPAPDLIVEWDPARRIVKWQEVEAQRTRSEALRPDRAFALQEGVLFKFTLEPPTIGGIAVESFYLESLNSYLFGRSSSETEVESSVHVVLDFQDRTISKLHARLCREDGDWILSDHSSTETLLNGEPFTKANLIFGDRFKIGDYVFEFRGTQILRVDHSNSGQIDAENLTVIVKDRETRKSLRILNNVSVHIGTGDFIGVLGGSGSGKSTLLNALCGIRPADEGKVSIGGIENSLLNKLRPGAIGYVPQDDIVHPELVVRDAFYLAARLRLRLKDQQRIALVERTIELLGLFEHAGKRVHHLSGGQRKRVSIGIELLSKPSVMFLDEPSSGLDPATEESLMELLQSLTLTNLTVVCTTHVLQKAYLFDRLVFVHGGRVIFEGNSSQARDFFVKSAVDMSNSHSGSRSSLGITKSPLEKIYSEVLRGTKTAAEWENEFRAWTGHQLSPPTGSTSGTSGWTQQTVEKRVLARTRFLTLLARQWKILRADWLNLTFLLCQVILIGLLIALVSDEFGFRMFLGLIATMWFGCSNGAQQIVCELPIVKREQICGLGRNVYLTSKFVFQGFISCIQGLLLFLIIIPIGHMIHPIDFDEINFRALYAMRLEKEGLAAPLGSISGEIADEPFMAVGDDTQVMPSVPLDNKRPEKTESPGMITRLTTAPPLWLVSTVAKWFVMEDSFIESGERPINDANEQQLEGADGRKLTFPAISVWRVLLVGVMFKILAFFGAALVGVSLGLAVSAWVRTPTQAVMWVPLLLIPQILFGGYVVTLPKMSLFVRTLSKGFPSNSCQRIVDVSNLYGRATPFVTNLTKQPVFLTGTAIPEEILWRERGNQVSQKFDRESYVNTSWQNLAVVADRLGQHKKIEEIAGTDANGSEIKRNPNTVKSRGDVRYSKGTPFLFTFPAVTALWILIGWICVCYSFALLGIQRKTHG